MKTKLLFIAIASLSISFKVYSQISFGPYFGYDIAKVKVGEVHQPFGAPITKGFENGSLQLGLRIEQNINQNISIIFSSGYSKKAIGENGVWLSSLNYHQIQNTLLIQKELFTKLNVGVGISNQFLTGFNYNLPDQSKSENHLGIALNTSYQKGSFIFELRYIFLLNLKQSAIQHVLSTQSFDFNVSYKFELSKIKK